MVRARTGGIGASLLLIAVGAIMAWAVTTDVDGFNINTAGVILLVIGIVGLIISLVMAYGVADREDHSAPAERTTTTFVE